MAVDYYQILGVSRTASTLAIKEAYRRLMRVHHPDRHGQQDDPLSRLLNEAYETLNDVKRRADYDRKLNGNNVSSRSKASTTCGPSSSQMFQDGQTISRRQVVCPDCQGQKVTGRLFKQNCPRCGGAGYLIAISAPASRRLCSKCQGIGQFDPIKELTGMTSFINLGQTCPRCGGTGLEPLPKVTGNGACPACHGFGYRLTNLHFLEQKETCGNCGGTGVDPNLSAAEARCLGLIKERCKDCDGYGYDRSLGPGFPCHRCNAKGWVPGRVFV